MNAGYGSRLREAVGHEGVVPLIGVYDVFSATLAARHFDGLFLSGFSFAASHYGLPDIGFIAWTDIVDLARRVRTVLPQHHLVVDIDDGYCDAEVACHVATLLEQAGASAVVLEDQQRPRRCGHFDGKQIMPLEGFLEKLEKVLATRRDMLVVARTDAAETGDILRRVEAFARAGADAVLADGIRDLEVLRAMRGRVPVPILFNQIRGGKSPACTITQLRQAGASMVIYSTPCLFAAQAGIEAAMKSLRCRDGLLSDECGAGVGVKECTSLLNENLARRDEALDGAAQRPRPAHPQPRAAI